MISTNNICTFSPIFFEMDNAHGKGECFVPDNNDETMYSQQGVATKCKSPFSSNAEICMAICILKKPIFYILLLIHK